MKNEKSIKTIFTILFIIFLGLYTSNKTGYYEYELHKKVELTNEQIEKFEDDVKNNKEIDIKDYLRETTDDYSNNISKASVSFSNITSKYIKKGINAVIDTLNKFMS